MSKQSAHLLHSNNDLFQLETFKRDIKLSILFARILDTFQIEKVKVIFLALIGMNVKYQTGFAKVDK